MTLPTLAAASRRAAGCLANAGLLASLLCGAAGAAEYQGRGLYKFKSESGCPFPALAPGDECNRVALDDAATVATLDRDSHTIRLTNTRVYDGKTAVADVLLQGSGLTRSGARVPLTFHAVLSRSGTRWSVNGHAHAPVPGRFTDIVVDPYRVVVNDRDDGERVILTPAQIDQAVSAPSLAARLVNAFVQVNDTRAGENGDPDVTIELGLGKAAAPVVRATFEAPRQPSGGKPPLDAALAAGTWSFQLQALSGRIPQDVVRRELFLYGLDTVPTVQPLMQERWPRNARLRVGAVDGKGYVAYGEQRQEFAQADEAARTFLQSSFVGLVLGWQQQPQPQAPAGRR